MHFEHGLDAVKSLRADDLDIRRQHPEGRLDIALNLRHLTDTARTTIVHPTVRRRSSAPGEL